MFGLNPAPGVPRWLIVIALVAVISLIAAAVVGIGAIRNAPWAIGLLGEEVADKIRYSTQDAIIKHLPRDMDRDDMPDAMEVLRGSSPWDYYNGRKIELLLRGELFRQSDFVYAGGRIRLQVQHRAHGAPTGAAEGTRITLDGQGGSFIAIPRRYFHEDDFDPATGEMRGLNDAGTGGLVDYQAPDEAERTLILTASSHGQRELSVRYPVRVLGRPRAPLPVREVISTRPLDGDSSTDRAASQVRVIWERMSGDHLGVAVEFCTYLKRWIIVADAAPDAESCEFDDRVVMTPPRPLKPEHFRVVPYTR
jgi:hypothetical protein